MDALVKKFESAGAEIYVVELEADVEERLKRNRTEHRLEEKPTKRNIEWSEKELLRSMQKYRLNSMENEVPYKNFLKIDNTHLSAEETAERIVRHFGI